MSNDNPLRLRHDELRAEDIAANERMKIEGDPKDREIFSLQCRIRMLESRMDLMQHATDLVKKVYKDRLTLLRDAANECIELLGWNADDDAKPDNEMPHDQTAHVNGLCRRILREAAEGSETP